ncbi:MAG: hypothetical protein HRT98_04380 [Mycoplasmatales bacterium]|nr:hypothetical protein [Mycoplasmatales bacterium]
MTKEEILKVLQTFLPLWEGLIRNTKTLDKIDQIAKEQKLDNDKKQWLIDELSRISREAK